MKLIIGILIALLALSSLSQQAIAQVDPDTPVSSTNSPDAQQATSTAQTTVINLSEPMAMESTQAAEANVTIFIIAAAACAIISTILAGYLLAVRAKK